VEARRQPVSYVENTYIRNYFTGALELVAMMLDWCDYTGDRRFLTRTAIPFANEILTFYDQHYKRDGQGRIELKPSQSLETWQDAVNPLPDIAGLQYVLDRLIAMPGGQNMMWIRMRSELPELPMATEKDRSTCSPPADSGPHTQQRESGTVRRVPLPAPGAGHSGLRHRS
jgi:hypothetical protein